MLEAKATQEPPVQTDHQDSLDDPDRKENADWLAFLDDQVAKACPDALAP